MTRPDTVHAKLTGVTRIYPAVAGHKPVHALGPIDLELRRGEFFGVVGPSGCGKSTLLEVLAGLQPATAGAVTFEGKPVRGDVPDGIGVVFQAFNLAPSLNAFENAMVPSRAAGVSRKDAKARTQELVRRVDLAGGRAHRPGGLSGSQQQRGASAGAVRSVGGLRSGAGPMTRGVVGRPGRAAG